MAKAKRWVVLTTAPDQLTAEMWQDILNQQGIPAVINPEDSVSFLGVSNFPCRLMVPPAELERAREILASLQLEEQP
jgi:hypothetical protein